jgi:carbon-monoxide dehydrogenase medium subunit
VPGKVWLRINVLSGSSSDPILFLTERGEKRSMKRLRPFAYFEPGDLPEASRLLLEQGGGAYLLAGGTDLLVRMKKGEVSASALVNLKRIQGLNGIGRNPGTTLSIGALAPISALVQSSLIRSEVPVLAQAAGLLGSPSIRNLATLGGNIGRASPASDMAPPLMVLAAHLSTEGPDGKREFPLESIFAGPGKTTLKPGEVMTSFRVPTMPPRSAAAYLKLGRREGMDMALVGVAVFLRLGEKGAPEDARIALASVAPIPIRARKAEEELLSGPLTEERMRRAALAAVSDSRPLSDMRASASYRREMIRVLTFRAIEEARRRAEGGTIP